ncbi:restriction endonuclease subunit S [Rivihabitans pingtungensis]|jgi:type I restriction enzyme S subunit|uniref:restriction endonuclease subunit S n=1 Tax=Rivihabitans pingtungensis TaxID=1054498 RepID=UPI002353E2C3|nr:restriction endonuclease subunit S [Rivihabitans pingtungensis]MCK6435929.1 restriction endonuclease subunit S [Rivihabitans pingtungensis]
MSEKVKLGAICDFVNGKAFNANDWEESGVPIIRIQNLNDESKSFNYCIKSIEEKYKVKNGDLLFSWSGTPGTSFGAFMWTRGDAYLNQHIFNVKIDSEVVDKRFLYHSLNASIHLMIDQAHGGVGLQHITKKKLEGIEINLPPLEEQKRIAAILDKADSLRRKRAQAIALADDFLRATFLDMFGDPVTNPKGWPVKPLGTLIEKIKSGWSAPSTDAEYIEGTLGVLKVSAVSSGYFKRAEAKVVDPSIVDRDLIFPVMGDLLFSRANTRELVAAACLVEEDCESAFLPDKLWQITCSHGVARNEYLKFLLADLKFKDELTKKATGTSGSMLNISQAKFVETNAPIPPYELQSRFADAVWRVYSLRKKWFESDYSIGNLFRGLSSDL